MFAYYALHGERLVNRHPPQIVLGVAAPVAAIFWALTFAPVVGLPDGDPDGRHAARRQPLLRRAAGGAGAACSMVFGTALPYALYLVGIGRVGPTLGLLSGTIEPVVAVIAAWLWIDQRLTALQVLGCVVVLTAVTGVQMLRSRQAEPVPA